MRAKMFVILFFEKVRFILLFVILVSASGYFIVQQIDRMVMEPEYIERPDITIMGDFVTGLDKNAEQDAEVYFIKAKELYSFESPFYAVDFCWYGVEGEFFDQFEGRLAEGRLPKQGRREMLVGGNAAFYYSLKVGDMVNENAEIVGGSGDVLYTISGILKEEDQYFASGLYVWKDEMTGAVCVPQDNMLMVYTPTKQIYRKWDDKIERIKEDGDIDLYVDNYKENSGERRGQKGALLTTLFISFLILELVYMHISKGMEKKAGIVKALGILDWKILMVCGLGLAILVTLTGGIVFMIGAFCSVRLRVLVVWIPVISIITFGVLFLQIAMKYKRITPSASMPAV